jgi:hypothetical protein
MYCPLCKAEYRDGFNRCSDCFTRLVTREEADAAKVVLLWKGTSVSKFDEIVAALRNANIPNRSRSGANPDSFYDTRSIIDRIPYISSLHKMKQQMSWEVSVLESDYAKATEITTG